MKEPRKRHHYADRVPIIAAELRRLNRSATRVELYEALKTEADGLFPDKRLLDATIRDDRERPESVFRREGKDRIALRNPADQSATVTYEPQESRVYERGQTVVPKKIRDALAVEEGTTLVWQVEKGVAHVVAIPTDPIGSLRGVLKNTGATFEEYLADRNADREREHALERD